MVTHWGSFLTLLFSIILAFMIQCEMGKDHGKDKKCHVTLFVSIWHVGIGSTIFLTFTTIMKATSTPQHNSVVSLLNEGYSQCQIKAKTGLGKDTISRISKEVDGNKENNPGGRPSKLSARDKQLIVRQIKFGKLENAVEATVYRHHFSQ
jgi:Trp repressor protein